MSVLSLINSCEIPSISHQVKIVKKFTQKSLEQNVPSVAFEIVYMMFSVRQSGEEKLSQIPFFHFKQGFL